MKDAEYVNEGAKAVKVLINSHNQICLDGLWNLDHELRKQGLVSTGNRVNNNGGYLMHFYAGSALISTLPTIRSLVEEIDENATIIVYNVSRPQPET